MKAQDLRLKNLVLNSNGDPIPLSIYNLITLHDWELCKPTEEPPFKPVDLTEEWLLKLGFNKFPGNGQLFDMDDFWAGRLIKDGMLDFDTIEVAVKHVHQLQNLYHSLTGEELTIKD